MTPEFAAALTMRLTELTENLRYTDKPTGEEVAPTIIETQPEAKTREYREGELFPLVRWSVYGGAFVHLAPAPLNVRIDAGIYTAGNEVAGTRDITELVLTLGGIVKEPWRFKPYQLSNRVPYTIGSPKDEELGMQPHPYYWGSLFLEFQVAGGYGG